MLMSYTNDYRVQFSEDLMHLFIADWFGTKILEQVHIFLFLLPQRVVVLSFFFPATKGKRTFFNHSTCLLSKS